MPPSRPTASCADGFTQFETFTTSARSQSPEQACKCFILRAFFSTAHFWAMQDARFSSTVGIAIINTTTCDRTTPVWADHQNLFTEGSCRRPSRSVTYLTGRSHLTDLYHNQLDILNGARITFPVKTDSGANTHSRVSLARVRMDEASCQGH